MSEPTAVLQMIDPTRKLRSNKNVRDLPNQTRLGRRVDLPSNDALYQVDRAPQLRLLSEPDYTLSGGSEFFETKRYPEFHKLLEPIAESSDFNTSLDKLYYLKPAGTFELSHEPGQSQFFSLCCMKSLVMPCSNKHLLFNSLSNIVSTLFINSFSELF